MRERYPGTSYSFTGEIFPIALMRLWLIIILKRLPSVTTLLLVFKYKIIIHSYYKQYLLIKSLRHTLLDSGQWSLVLTDRRGAGWRQCRPCAACVWGCSCRTRRTWVHLARPSDWCRARGRSRVPPQTAGSYLHSHTHHRRALKECTLRGDRRAHAVVPC